MKKTVYYFLLAIISVASFVSCAKELTEEKVEVIPVAHSIIKFKATPGEVGTKATLTPNSGDTEFTATWTDGDEMILNAVSTAESFDEDATSIWDESKGEFSADFGETILPTGSSAWEYKAWYPAKAAIPFGTNRVQNGNNYNSDYDVMYGTLSVANGKIGKDDSDNAIVVEMNHLTGIAYFHITGGPDEDVLGATLTTTENLAANTVSISGDGSSVTPTDGVNRIDLTFSSCPNATDFKLWFNVLPGSYTGLSLTIYTETKKASISASSITFTAGKLNKVKKNITSWSSQLYYNKVKAVGDLEESDYLIVYEPDKVAFDGSLANPDAGNNVIDVPIVGNSFIPTNSTIDESSFHIAPEASSKYSILASGGKYIGRETASNGMDQEDDAQDNTISFGVTGNAVISGTGGYQLRFNSSTGASNYRFRYYASDKQQDIALYKLLDTRASQSLSFPSASYDATYPGTFDNPALSGAKTTVTYSSSNTSVATVNSSTGAITLTGIGSTTIKANAAADATYKAASASYTLIVASAPITTIALLKANLTTTPDDFDITLTNAIVSLKDGNNAYIEDASAGIYMYNCASALSVGDKFNGEISVTAKVYNGQPEITAFDGSSATKTTGAEPYETTVTVSALLDGIDTYDGMRIKLEGVQLAAALSGKSNVMVSRGASSIKIYSKDSDMDLAKDDIVDLIGYPVNYNGTSKQVYVFDDGDVDVKSITWNLKSIAVTTVPTKTSYVAGEYFNPAGMVVTGTYEDSTEEYTKYVDVTASCTYSPSTSTALTTSDVSITISYGGKSTSQAIKVSSSGNTWTRVTAVDQITDGGTFIIGYEAEANTGVIVPMRQEDAAASKNYIRSGTTSGSSTNQTITMSSSMSAASTADYETVIVAGSSSGNISFKVGTKYVQDSATASDNKCTLSSTQVDGTDFTPSIGENDVVIFTSTRTVAKNKVDYHPKFQFNNNSGSYRFTCYTTGAQKNLVLYKKN